jgi:hypothetical protein
MAKKPIRSVERKREEPSRQALLVGRIACEVHEQCCAHWCIQPDKDVCARELNSTVSECPDRIPEGNGYAYKEAAS